MSFFADAKKSPLSRAAVAKSTKALDELISSPDLVTAIVGAAILDGHLAKCLTNRFIADEGRINKFFKDGPGQETNAKIKLAYLLGILSKEARDMHQHRQIGPFDMRGRNVFLIKIATGGSQGRI